MRIAIAVLALLVLGVSARAQTTYTQMTHSCTPIQCADAQLMGPIRVIVTVAYGIRFDTCGQKDVSGFVKWDGAEFGDLKASMVWLGYHYKGQDYYPDGIWQVQGTFNNGTMSLTETFRTYKGCSGGYNLDGEVVTP